MYHSWPYAYSNASRRYRRNPVAYNSLPSWPVSCVPSNPSSNRIALQPFFSIRIKKKWAFTLTCQRLFSWRFVIHIFACYTKPKQHSPPQPCFFQVIATKLLFQFHIACRSASLQIAFSCLDGVRPHRFNLLDFFSFFSFLPFLFCDLLCCILLFTWCLTLCYVLSGVVYCELFVCAFSLYLENDRASLYIPSIPSISDSTSIHLTFAIP